MARQPQPVAQLIADLFVAIEQDDPLSTLEAAQALADRIGAQAATTITSALLAEHRQPYSEGLFPLASEQVFAVVSCA